MFMPIGTNPEWNFPRRRCDDCGKSYKPTRPNSRYCSTKCRDAHNRHGGAYRKLKVEITKEIARQIRATAEELRMEFEQIARREIQRVNSLRGIAEVLHQSFSPSPDASRANR